MSNEKVSIAVPESALKILMSKVDGRFNDDVSLTIENGVLTISLSRTGESMKFSRKLYEQQTAKPAKVDKSKLVKRSVI